MGRKAPKPPKEDPAVAVARDRQIEELAELDEDENVRIKRLLVAARGTRGFRGNSVLSGARTSRGSSGGGTPNGTAGRGSGGGNAGGISRGGRGGGSSFKSLLP